MSREVEVVYENGVLKPLKKIEFREGEVLRIEIKGKIVTDRFREKLERLKERVGRFEDTYKILEEMRNDRY